MADYYPLLARALDALPDRSPAMRKAVYDRARNALIAQLRSLEPPLSEADIELEREALDKAIGRLEADYGTPAPPQETPAQEAPPQESPRQESPQQESSPQPAAQQPEPEPPPVVPAPAPAAPVAPPPEPFLPPAPEPSFLPEPAPPQEAAVPVTVRRPKAQEPEPAPTEPVAPVAPASEPAPANDPAGPRQRPRIDVVAPGGGRSRMLRNAFVGVVLAVVIGLIAVAAFLLRDKPANIERSDAETAEGAQPEGTDTKFSDRVGGEPAPRQAAPGASSGETRAQARPSAQPDLAVAQRAVLIEENVETPNAAPLSTNGRVLWRLDSVAGEQGRPLETAVVATVGFPEAGLTLVMTIQRNLDQTLPASHTISLAFTTTGSEGEGRTVQDVGLLQGKDDEAARGSPVSGLPVRVRENLFLIGLSSLKGDVDRNTDLLLHRPWFDLALRYGNGRRAVITFEKGASGTQAMETAFEQWR